jgi:O-antigen/teichoic acid export membrane protein
MINTAIDRLRKRPLLKNTMLLVGGTASAQLITVVATPIISRIYLPEHFGALTVFESLLNIAVPLATLRYAVAIPIAENEELADDVIRLSFMSAFLISLVFGLVLLLFGPIINEQYDVNISPYFWLLPISLFGAGIYETLTGWGLRRKRIRLLSRTRLMQGFSDAISTVALGLLGIKPLGLMVGYFASKVSGSGRLLFSLLEEKKGIFREFTWQGIITSAKRFQRFPLLQSWSRLLLGLGSQLPALFVAAYFGAETTGYFGMASNLIDLPLVIISLSLSQVYFAEIASYGRSQAEKIKKLTIKIVKQMLLLGSGPVAAIMIFGPWVFAFFLGEEWRQAGIYARYLSLMLFFRFITTPVIEVFSLFEQQQIQIYTNLVRVFVICTVFLFCHYMHYSIDTTLIIYSLSLSIIVFLGILLLVLRVIDQEIAKQQAS